MTEPTIEDYFLEERTFPPSPEFKAAALTADDSLYREADADYEAFWARQARELLTWNSDFDTTLEWELPFAKWFVGGTLNVSENCLDRHVANGIGDRVAYHWEGEPGDKRTITYSDLLEEVKKFANVLKGLGLEKGDRVAIYMPMIPELPVAMLACTRIGVAHSVIFGGFSPDSIIDRVHDGECKVIITADGGYRRGAASLLKPNVDEAVVLCPSVTDVVVVQRTNSDVTMVEGRDHWYHDLMAAASPECPAEPMDSEQLLYLLYTSGTTAKPKGIMHTTGGYLTQVAFTYKYVFDLKPETDVYWCSADIGWVTGHSYIVYGPLVNGATSVLYEGTPDTPGKDRMWDIIERYGVTQLYTAPTAIRMFMKWGEQEPQKHDLSSLRLLGSVGESINPEAWMWYNEHIGVEVVDEEGHPIERGGGYLTLTRPWPAMLRGIWGAPERYKDTYWSRYPGRYFAGDGAKIDDDGYIWLLGRVDDVMNVSGHRISTTEVESALVDHTSVAEAAVVGATDDLTGQAIVGYVILRGGITADDALVDELRAHVATKIGPTARPKRVIIVPDLPKTRSGKIMRRLLRDIADGNTLGDTTTLADPSVVDAIRESALHGPGSGK